MSIVVNVFTPIILFNKAYEYQAMEDQADYDEADQQDDHETENLIDKK